MSVPQQPLARADAVAAWLDVSVDVVYEMAADGRLPAFKVGGQLRFDWDAVRSALPNAKKEAAA